MELKAKIMDESAVHRSVARITHEIIEKNRGAEGICLLGVKRRGIPLAKMLRDNIKKFEGIDVPLGHTDITLYRDDLSESDPLPTSEGCEIPCNVSDYNIIIVDDVIYTGRTARAAIDSVFKFGRPKSIQLAVLIDRGHRELPIRPDFVGKNIPTSKSELVSVLLDEVDGETAVCLYNI
ncbi:MAG: bifunctional pyr operon transcriptional regulator/uracil phosphoribosyltransferase PyrR [Oscillospiraceae bacterium]|nr:bifunctional pyr operon transcriptional regulator/uracil phosphoribosyltransferase PyrR [Oscillospiraceae bacterium]MBQ4544630.1 bifunctional pyr operon transcriptional regulator/uracil phosphoribosyltransferase PyrR [Oscillospiraceae bacterium]MBQ6901735.1 bifunctional pyr operon transcriptional regulator/uracil phosphoribosyltransferase PyrR [Oscillospiraceae bacterium]